MTAETLAATAGIVLSLVFSYVPKFSTWYGLKDDPIKRLIMLGALVLVSGVAFGLACSGLASDFGLPLTCDKVGAVALLRAFVVAAIANQTTYALTPYSSSRASGRGLKSWRELK